MRRPVGMLRAARAGRHRGAGRARSWLVWSGGAGLAWAVLQWYAGPALQPHVGWLLSLCGGVR